MGTHPSGPSSILQAKVPLGDVLKENPHFVGFVPQGYPSDDLPFLFKVLSINTALSIQVFSISKRFQYLFFFLIKIFRLIQTSS